MTLTKVTIPLSRPFITEDDVTAVADVLRSGWLTAGPKVTEFEVEISRYCGFRPALAVCSGTAALHLALILGGVGEGDEVITTPMTFAATANVIWMVGAKPVFVDIDPESWNIDHKALVAAFTKRTKAVLPVHFAGRPCEMEKINEIARGKNVSIIEDAAQAFGAYRNGHPIGSGGNYVCFSFHPMKQITTGEGGALILPKEEALPLARRLRFHGIEKDAWKTFQGAKKDVPYDIAVLGYKYNMSDISAALGLQQLKREREFARRRREIAGRYLEAFGKLELLQVPLADDADAQSSWSLFHVVLDKKISRDAFMEELKQNGVLTGIYYRALHLSSFYKSRLGDLEGKFPNAEMFSSRAVALPIFPSMTDEQAEQVIYSVKSAVDKRGGRG